MVILKVTIPLNLWEEDDLHRVTLADQKVVCEVWFAYVVEAVVVRERTTERIQRIDLRLRQGGKMLEGLEYRIAVGSRNTLLLEALADLIKERKIADSPQPAAMLTCGVEQLLPGSGIAVRDASGLSECVNETREHQYSRLRRQEAEEVVNSSRLRHNICRHVIRAG